MVLIRFHTQVLKSVVWLQYQEPNPGSFGCIFKSTYTFDWVTIYFPTKICQMTPQQSDNSFFLAQFSKPFSEVCFGSVIIRPKAELTFGQYIKIPQVCAEIGPISASLSPFLTISHAKKWGYPDVGSGQDIRNCQYFMIMTVWGVQSWRSKKAQPFEILKFLVNVHKVH